MVHHPHKWHLLSLGGMSCYLVAYHATWWHIKSLGGISFHLVAYQVTWWHIMSLGGLSSHLVTYQVTKWHLLSLWHIMHFIKRSIPFSWYPFPSQMIHSFIRCSMNPKCSIAFQVLHWTQILCAKAPIAQVTSKNIHLDLSILWTPPLTITSSPFLPSSTEGAYLQRTSTKSKKSLNFSPGIVLVTMYSRFSLEP